MVEHKGPALAQYYSDKDGDGRAYKHPGSGVRVPSITTCLKFEAKDALIQWAANETLKWCIAHWQVLGERSDESAMNVGRYKWKNVRDERAEVGTGVHQTLEMMNTDGWDYPLLDAEQEAMVANYFEFTNLYTFRPVHNEVTVWSHEHMYAGTADAFAWAEGPDVPGGYYWVDYKTSKNTWPAHWMQLAALRNADVIMVKDAEGWHEEPMPDSVGALVLHLRADKWDVGLLKNESIRWQQFLNYRSLWGLDQELKSVVKSEMSGEEF